MGINEPFRNPQEIKSWLDKTKQICTRKWSIMEVCGGQTHSIVRSGIDELLSDCVELLHGPGCPVCVTPIDVIDQAIETASRPEVIFCTFADMLRVPGTEKDLLQAKANGADVRLVYSPTDSVAIARANPARQVVFFAVGFETTAPANAMTVLQAHKLGLTNFSLLTSQVLVPPAIETLMSNNKCKIEAFLAAGHVCTIMGYEQYIPLAKKYKVPIVVTGFEPLDIAQGLYLSVLQLEQERYTVENQYVRSVQQLGNLKAIETINEVFQVSSQQWRGLGELNASSLKLREKYRLFDARERLPLLHKKNHSDPCRAGEVLQGLIKPNQCEYFGKSCVPDSPMGATMVSSEGACSAYYNYRQESLCNSIAPSH